jgi:hypothetical protein
MASTELLADDAYVGRVRLAPRRFDYMFVTIRLYGRDSGTTIHHQPIGEHVSLAISATVWANRSKRGDCHTAGQCVEELLRVEPDGRLDGSEIRDLVKVWREWHLNDMRAGCAHQDVADIPPAERLDRVPPCSESVPRYRYGSAWLVEPLPAEVERFVRAIAAKLTVQRCRLGEVGPA